MGNSGSTVNSNCKNCNSCSQNGLYYENSFGKAPVKKYYQNYVVYKDVYGRRYTIQGGKRHFLPKGARTTSKIVKVKSPKRKVNSPRRKPKNYYKDRYVPSKFVKSVKDRKGKKIGSRLSARSVYNSLGRSAIGRSFNVLQKDGSYKIKFLRLRKNGSPYFANNFGNINEFVVKPTHLTFNTNKNWLRGRNMCKLTGVKNSWPNDGFNIPPSGVPVPLRTSLLSTNITSKGLNKNNMNFGA